MDIKQESVAAQLERLISRVEELNSERFLRLRERHRHTFREHALRLRPSCNSFSLVSCAAETPQLGFSGLRNAESVEITLNTFNPGVIFKKLGRKTPEKVLQSWMIKSAEAQKNEFQFLPKLKNERYWFLTDEIALFKEGKRIVADILALRTDSDSATCLVSIELKSKRDTKTFKQVDAFRSLLDDEHLAQLWRDLARKFAPSFFRNSSKLQGSRGMVIWPAARSGRGLSKTTELIAEKKRAGVLTLEYSRKSSQPPHFELFAARN